MNKSSKDALEKYTYRLLGTTTLLLIATATVFYHFVESLRWLDAIYFSVITVATVGYGDITPHTDAGKIFTIFYVLFGIGLIAAFASSLVRRAGKHRIEKVKSKK